MYHFTDQVDFEISSNLILALKGLNVYIHTCIQTYIQMYIRTYIRIMYIRTYVHTYICVPRHEYQA